MKRDWRRAGERGDHPQRSPQYPGGRGRGPRRRDRDRRHGVVLGRRALSAGRDSVCDLDRAGDRFAGSGAGAAARLVGGHFVSALVGFAVLKLTGPQAWAAAPPSAFPFSRCTSPAPFIRRRGSIRCWWFPATCRGRSCSRRCWPARLLLDRVCAMRLAPLGSRHQPWPRRLAIDLRRARLLGCRAGLGRPAA